MNHPLSLGHKGAMQADHVCTPKKFLQLKSVQALAGIVGMFPTRKDHLHSHCLCDPADLSPNAAESHQSHHLSGQLDQRGSPETPIATPRPLPSHHRIAVESHVVT